MSDTVSYGLPFAADFLHLSAVTILLINIVRKRSSTGISGRSLILFATSYIFRYPKIWQRFYTPNNIVHVLIIGVLSSIIFLVYFGFNKTYQRKKDIFVTEILVIPSFLLSIWITYGLTTEGITRTFGLYLESVAILPQFYMVFDQKRLEKGLIPYLTALVVYKTTYVAYWLYIYQAGGDFDPIQTGTGILYTTLFVLAFVQILCLKVKVTDSGSQNFFKNLFLIHTNEPLTDRLNLVDEDHLENDKNESDPPAGAERV